MPFNCPSCDMCNYSCTRMWIHIHIQSIVRAYMIRMLFVHKLFFSQGFHIEASVFLKSQVKNFIWSNHHFFQKFWELIITKKNISWNDWNNIKIQIRIHKEFGHILRFASGSICKYAVIILSSLILKLSGLEMGLHVYDGRDSVVLCINYKKKLSLNNDACRHRITM